MKARYHLLLIAVLIGISVPVRNRLEEMRDFSTEREEGRAAWVLLPGGFRVFAVSLLGFRADALQRKGRFEEMLGVYHWIARLQPANELVMLSMGCELVYTVPALERDPDRRWQWILEGIRLLKRGLRHHPGSSMIAGQLGAIYVDVCASDPRIREAFEAIEGRSPLHAALDAFTKAQELEGVYGQAIALCLTRLAQQRLGDLAVVEARSFLNRAETQLEQLKRRHPQGTESWNRWLDRNGAWMDLIESLILADEAREKGELSIAERHRDTASDLLRRIRERFPEDEFADSFEKRLRLGR